MTDFLPTYTARADFSSGTPGALVFTSVPASHLSAQLSPFFKGEPGVDGPQGVQGAQGVQGPPGTPTSLGSNGDLKYTHTQGIASANWVIPHALGKFPAVTVIDSAGSEVEGSVSHTDANNLIISFSAAFGGFAHLN